jgi:hypothetical protein
MLLKLMIDHTLPIRRAVADIVYAYRQILGERGQPLSLRSFAIALNKILDELGEGVSHQTIKNWEDRAHLPHPYYMTYISLKAPNDWRRDFAEDILSALRPNLYQPATDIGHWALERSLTDTGPQKPRFDNRFLQP